MLRSALVAHAILAAVSVPLAAQAPGKSAYTVYLGNDTVAVEVVVRTPGRLEGDLVTKVPSARRIHYVATLTPAGDIAKLEIDAQPAPGARGPVQKGTLTFGPDTAVFEVTVNGAARTARTPAKLGAVPLLSGHAVALYEPALAKAMKAAGDTTAILIFSPGARQPTPSAIVRRSRDTYEVSYFGDPVLVTMDDAGHLVSWDGRRTTNKIAAARAADADVAEYARAWGAREASGQAAGQLSPRDTTRATIGAASLLVDYGRPSKRGRVIFGGIEPWGKVWRTGANAATQLETSRDLMFAGTTVPAGKYTLWTLLSETQPMLIINRQTGQWGTEYSAAQDVVRLPLLLTRLPTPVEQFTIAIEPRGAGGVLTLSWDTTEFSVPFSVK